MAEITNKILTKVELDSTQAQIEIAKLNAKASDTTKSLEERISAKNKEVKLQEQLSKKNIAALEKEVRTLKKMGASEKEVERATAKLNREKIKQAKVTERNTKQNNKLNASYKKNRDSAKLSNKSIKILGRSFNLLQVGITAAIASFALIIRKGAEFGKALSSLEAVSGATKVEMKALSNQAKELGASTAFTASEVVSLQTELAKLGRSAEQIQDSTPAILDLAASLEVGLADAAAFAGSTVNAFGLEAKDTQRVVDIMAESAASSAQDFSTLKESFTKAAPAASALGVSVERTSALLGILSNSGITGSEAGTAVKNSFIELKKEGLTLEEGLSKIKNSSDKLGTAIELAGKRGGPALLILSKNQEGIGQLEEKLNGAAGAAQRMAEVKLDNLAGDTTKLGSAFEGFILSIEDGEGILNGIARAAVQATTAILNFLTPTVSLTAALEEQRLALFNSEAQINKFDKKIADASTSEEELKKATDGRTKVIKDLQKKYPNYLKNIDAEKSSAEELQKALDKVNDSLINKIILQKEDEEILEQAEDTADAKIDLLEDEQKAQEKVNKIRKKYSDLGIEIKATSPNEVLKELNELHERENKLRAEGNGLNKLTANQASKLNGDRVALGNAISSLSSSQESYNKELNKSNKLEEKRVELKKRLGIEDDAPSGDDGGGDDGKPKVDPNTIVESDEEREIRLAKEAKIKKEKEDQRRKDLEDIARIEKSFKEKSEDLDDEDRASQIERGRARALEDIDAIKDETINKEQAKKNVKEYFDKLLKEDEELKEEEERQKKRDKLGIEAENELLSFEERRQRLKDQRQLILDDESLDEEARLEMLRVNTKAKLDLKKQETADTKAQKDAERAIQDAHLNNISAGIGLLKSIAGKSKVVQAASIIGENAVGIAKQIQATQVANTAALATPQAILTGGTSAIPIIAANNLGMKLGIATSIAATAKGLASLKSKSASSPAPPAPTPTPPRPAGQVTSRVNDLSANNASRVGTNSSISDNATASALRNNQSRSGGSSVAFYEGTYQEFRRGIDFRDGHSTIGG